jgi:hypothetical protein
MKSDRWQPSEFKIIAKKHCAEEMETENKKKQKTQHPTIKEEVKTQIQHSRKTPLKKEDPKEKKILDYLFIHCSFVLFCSHVLPLSHLVTSHLCVSGTRMIEGELPHLSTIHHVAHCSVLFCPRYSDCFFSSIVLISL